MVHAIGRERADFLALSVDPADLAETSGVDVLPVLPLAAGNDVALAAVKSEGRLAPRIDLQQLVA